MKAFALIASLLAGQYGPGNTKTLLLPEEALTRAVPTLATEGFDLRGVLALRVTVCAKAPDTLSGTGSLVFYYRSPDGWGRWKAHDFALSAGGGKCETTEFPISVGMGRVLAAPSSVGVSGATTTVSVRYEAAAR
jgi:hypothetical protein